MSRSTVIWNRVVSPSHKEPLMLATPFLLTFLFVESAVVWWQIRIRWQRKQPILEWNDLPRAGWNSASELAVAYIALLLLTLQILPKFLSSNASVAQVLDSNQIAIQILINLCLSFLLPCALIWGGRSWSEIGMPTSKSREQMRLGVKGFFAAVLPMAISMTVTLPFRGIEQQHSLLKLLGGSPDLSTVFLIAVLAVLSAPLFEEMLFRVILQGWLTTIFPAAVSIPIVAILFALVHGWRDGLALLPLALILGYVFYRQHSYLAVVVIHALFNATMLALQLMNPQVPQ